MAESEVASGVDQVVHTYDDIEEPHAPRPLPAGNRTHQHQDNEDQRSGDCEPSADQMDLTHRVLRVYAGPTDPRLVEEEQIPASREQGDELDREKDHDPPTHPRESCHRHGRTGVRQSARPGRHREE